MNWVMKREAVAWRLALLTLLSLLLLPLFLCDVPPLGDYPNHLGRAFVLASLPGDPVLARMYAMHWSIIPNLGIDLILPPLIHVLPIHVAGRLFIGLCILLPVLGAIACTLALEKCPAGRWWSLGVGLAAYNNCLMYGFLNFSLAVGLALLLSAVWFRWREDRPVPTIAVTAIGTLALFACHLMGLAFFGVLAGCREMSKSRGAADAARRCIVLAGVFALPLLLYRISALEGLGGDAQWLAPLGKLRQLAATFTNYNWWLDMLTAAATFGIPSLAIALRCGRFARPIALAIIVIVAAYAVAPYAWKGTFSLDTRFAVMLGFLMFIGFRPIGWWPPAVWVVSAGLAALFLVRTAVLCIAWVNHNAVLASVRGAIAPVQPGQAVYVADAGTAEAPSYWAADPNWLRLSDGTFIDGHLAALVLIERRAYWPFEFDVPSQQPIITQPPYAALAARLGGLPDRGEALTADLCGYDYVLMLDASAVVPLPKERFALLSDGGFAALYRIIAAAAAAGMLYYRNR